MFSELKTLRWASQTHRALNRAAGRVQDTRNTVEPSDGQPRAGRVPRRFTWAVHRDRKTTGGTGGSFCCMTACLFFQKILQIISQSSIRISGMLCRRQYDKYRRFPNSSEIHGLLNDFPTKSMRCESIFNNISQQSAIGNLQKPPIFETENSKFGEITSICENLKDSVRSGANVC